MHASERELTLAFPGKPIFSAIRAAWGTLPSGGGTSGGTSGGTAPSGGGSVQPSASEISRIAAKASLTEEYIIQATAAIETVFAHLNIVSGLIYIHAGDVAGVLQATSGTTYVGQSAKFLTEYRAAGEQNIPIIISELNNSAPQQARRCVKGTAGDRVLLVYQPT